jgi:hypothetical protein
LMSYFLVVCICFSLFARISSPSTIFSFVT